MTAKERLATVPEVPIVDEAGMADFYMSDWHGIWAPDGVAAAVRDVLDAAIVETLADRPVRKRLEDLGQAI